MILDEQKMILAKALKFQQPIGDLYACVLTHSDLVYISFADIRKLREGDDVQFDDYIGIQRNLSEKRKAQIGKYVNLIDATFPNSIILAINSEYCNYNSETSELSILYKDDIATVIDGQHRIAGLELYRGEDGGKFDCLVTIFINMDIEDQAMVFSTINNEQKNVSKSLMSDLYAFAQSRSPHRSAHLVARAVNRFEYSPLYKRIKVLGFASREGSETITQATFTKTLIQYMSKDPQSDRNELRKHPNRKIFEYVNNDYNKYFLRTFFVNERENDIAQLVINYFFAIQKRWPTAWVEVRENKILNRSTGFIALMNFFRDAYLSVTEPGNVVSATEFYNIFESIDLPDDHFDKDNYKPGNTGIAELYKDLKRLSGL